MATQKDLRASVERMIDEGAALDEVAVFVDSLNENFADRDALWCWARAYFELRPVSIFRGRVRRTAQDEQRPPIASGKTA